MPADRISGSASPRALPGALAICKKAPTFRELFLWPPALAATLRAIAGATSKIVPDDFFVWAAENGFK